MTKNEAIERIRRRICNEGIFRKDKTYHFCNDSCMYGENQCEIAIAIAAIKKQIENDNNSTPLNIHTEL